MQVNNAVNVFASPLPFSNLRVHHFIPEGATLADMVEAVAGKDLEAVVFINDHIIFRDNWHLVRPKQGTLVNIRIVPQGGGGKNPLSALLSIALLIAAPYLSSAILGSTLAATSALGGLTTYGGLLSGAIGIVGKLLVSALAPPPRPSSAGTISNPSESPTLFVEGARNTINRFGTVPICLGTNRMFPLQAALPYQETAGKNQFVRQLFTYGWGGNLQISELKIGETSLSEFEDVEIEHRLSGDLHIGTNIYSRDVFQDEFNVLLKQVDGYAVRTTQAETDEISVDVTFPSGLSQFTEQAQRISRTVQLELQFAPTGTSAWSPATNTFTAYSGASLPVASSTFSSRIDTYRRDVVAVNGYTGVISIIKGTESTILSRISQLMQPIIPINTYRLATAIIQIDTDNIQSIYSFSDDRQSSQFGVTLQNSSSFVPSFTGTTINVTGGGLAINDLVIMGATAEALRVSKTVRVPSRGQYDIRIRRLTADTVSDQIVDKVYLTAVRSIKFAPPVTLEGINGTAIRMRGTNQLNGAVDQFNAVVSNIIPDYDTSTETWINRNTSNPASIYRYVLQGAANYRALANSKIGLADIEAWHTYCEEKQYTYNRVIDYKTTLYEVLKDVAAAGAASPTINDGKFTIVVDRDKPDIVQMITPRNSWNYSAELVYPDVPHAFRVQFRNAEKGYNLDERIVYDDGYSEANATKFEELEYLSCTNSALAFKHGRRHIATARLRPETHQLNMDIENIVMTRGDRIKFAHDVPIIGVGDGRVKSVTDNGTHITGFTIDDVADFISGRTYYVRIRKADNTQLYLALAPLSGEQSSFTLSTPLLLASGFAIGDLCYFVEAGGELDLIVTRIEPQNDLTARITAVDYSPAIFTAESAPIPFWQSNITTNLQLLRPLPPLLASEPQSDELLLIRNSDGSFTSRMSVSLINQNDGQIEPVVLFRLSGTTQFQRAQLLQSSSENVVITGLQDGLSYDIWISYRRVGTVLQSVPLQLNTYKFIGASALPQDVTNFRSTITEGIINLSWNANPDIDTSHYILKFSRVFTGATWESSQVLESSINETRIILPFIGGTYLIKAVDLLGNESSGAAVIITYADSQANVVETLIEQPSWVGVKDNCEVNSETVMMIYTMADAYYYFDNAIDLGAVFSNIITAKIIAEGAFTYDIYSVDDIYSMSDIYGGSAGADLYSVDDIYSITDIYGGAPSGSWGITLEARFTDDDPSGSPVWTAWQPVAAGSYSFRGAEFRILLQSFAVGVTPKISVAEVTIDMPDRIERGEDIAVPAGGVTITHSPAFKAIPAVAITLQDGATDDRIDYSSKTASGFTFRVYNATLAAYVARTFDYIASGYGRAE